MAEHEVGIRLSLKERRETAAGLAESERGIEQVGDAAERSGKQASIGARGFRSLLGGMRGAASFAGRGFVGAMRGVGRVTASATRGAVIGVTALSIAIGGLSYKAIGLAGDARETASAFDAVFGPSAGRLGDDIDDLSKRFGLYAPELQDAARQLGVFGKAAGVARSDLPKFSKDLVQAGLDLSSFYNVSSAEAFQAIQSGLSGEAEPLRRFGIFISDAAMKAQAAQMGLTDELTEQQKVMVRHRLIMQGLGDAQGDLERTSRGFANQQRAAGGRIQSILSMLGGPLTTAATGAFRGLNAILKVAMRILNREMPDLEHKAKKTSQTFQRWGYETARNLPDTLRTVGRWAGWVGDQAQKLPAILDAVRAGGRKVVDTFGGLNDDGGLTELKGNLVELQPAAAALGQQMPGINDALSVTNTVTGFLAKHTDTLAKYMPALVAGYVALKVSQIAANTVAAASPVLKLLDYRATRMLVKANRELVAVQRAATGSTVANTGATSANTAAQSTGLFARARHTAGIVTQRVATTAATAATKAATVAQRLLSAAFIASPIGLIVLGVAALAAGFVLAYRKSETFREIVTGALNAVKGAAVFVWNWVKQNWPLLLGILTGPFGIAVVAIVKNWDRIKAGAASVKDWVTDKFGALVGFFKGMPGRIGRASAGLFDGLKDAFRGAVNFIIDGWNGLSFSLPGFDPPGPGPKFPGITIGTPDIPRLAHGGPVTAGMPYIVGDRGPRHAWEMFVPEQNGYVHPRVQPLRTVAPAAPQAVMSDAAFESWTSGGTGADLGPSLPVRVELHVDGRKMAETVVDAFDRDKNLSGKLGTAVLDDFDERASRR